ncbi:MAG: 1,2-phenylacetyl-CoA epoxidase subunit PaaC [Anaerolineales bacterium]
MTSATHPALPDLIVRLADNKYLLGRRFSEWTNRAPALEAAVAAAAMTQDELGHARSLYAALHSLPDSPAAYLRDAPQKRDHLLGLPQMEKPFEHWVEFVAACALFDRALTLVFEAARNSRYEPLRQRAAKILQEERFHRQYAEGWLKRLAADTRTRGALQAAVDELWHPTAGWLDATDASALVDAGILAESAEALRARWSDETKSLLTECGLVTTYDR